MELIQPLEQKIIRKIIAELNKGNYKDAAKATAEIVQQMHSTIPDKKRISYGIVYCVKTLAKHLFSYYSGSQEKLLENAGHLFESETDFRAQAVGLGMISHYGLQNFEAVLPFFVDAAGSDNWDIREMAQMYFRKLIKKHPGKAQKFLLEQVKSNNENTRRFVSETMRPVCENKWFYEQPDYSLTVLRHLFAEKKAYPRTSIGNNLSDIARKLPDLIFEIVDELVASGNKNSYRIATRACRNLVKTQKIRVLDALKTDEYKYKKNTYKRNEN